MRLSSVIFCIMISSHGIATAQAEGTTFQAGEQSVDRPRAFVFSAKGLPPGVSINPRTGHISGSIARAANWRSADVFRIHVSYHNGDGASGETIVEIRPKNSPPLAVNDQILLPRHAKGAVSIRALDNDTDADGDELDITSARARHGTVVTFAGGHMLYLSSDDAKDDMIDYEINDGHDGVASGQVILKAVM